MPFYTEHPGFAWCTNPWSYVDDEGRRFHDPDLEAVQDWVLSVALTHYRNLDEWKPPAYLAHECKLPSGNAAVHAVRDALNRSTHRYRFDVADFYAHFSDSPDEDDYIPPEDPSEDGEHSAFCACNACYCECGECSCDVCYPDGPLAACESSSCDYCHSECDFDCETCHPDDCECEYHYDDDDDDDDDGDRVDSFDDQDDDDTEFTGRPNMPDPVPGRCRFGIEVEFNAGDRRHIAEQLVYSGIACSTRDYTHETVPYWKMTTDATVTGGEIVSPILRGDDQSIEEVREVLRVVKASGGYTARNVGMHVHLDVTMFRTEELEALAHNLRASEKMLAGFVPKHRYSGSNDYGARLINPRGWDAIQEWISGVDPSHAARSRENRERSCPVGRYVSMNFNSLLTYGTVECRLLGHTLNTIKVRTWIRVLQSIVEASAQHELMPTCDGLAWLGRFGLEAEYASHFRQVVESRNNEPSLVCGVAA